MTKTQLAATAAGRVPTIGLALGGGGARGLAHVLVLEVLEELGISPTVIAGTSIGAIYGAALASGLSAAHVRALTEETLGNRVSLVRQLLGARSDPIGKLWRVLPTRSSLLKPEAVLDLVLPGRFPATFDDLKIPLRISATDLATHRAIALEAGDLRSAIAASMAIPVLFSPVARDGHLLLDGGLTNPCPWDLIDRTCDISIAIDVSGAASEAAIGPSPSAIAVMVQSTQILQKSITRERLKHRRPQIYVDVDLDRFGALEFYRPREILAAAEPVKDALRRQLDTVLSAAG